MDRFTIDTEGDGFLVTFTGGKLTADVVVSAFRQLQQRGANHLTPFLMYDLTAFETFDESPEALHKIALGSLTILNRTNTTRTAVIAPSAAGKSFLKSYAAVRDHLCSRGYQGISDLASFDDVDDARRWAAPPTS